MIKQIHSFRTVKSLFLTVAFCAVPNYATAYQFDVSLLGAKADYEDKDKYTAYGLVLEAFLEPIEVQKGPYAEQDFITRTPSVGVIGLKYDFDLHDRGSSEITAGGVAVTFMADTSNLLVDSGYFGYEQDAEFDNGQKFDSDLQNYWLKLGYFFQQQTAVYAITDYYEWEMLAIKDEELHLGIGTKALVDKFNIEAELLNIRYDSDGEEDTNYEVSIEMDYYFMPSLSVGGYIVVNRGQSDEEELDGFGISFLAFIQQQFYVEVEYSSREAKHNDNLSSDRTAVIFGVRW